MASSGVGSWNLLIQTLNTRFQSDITNLAGEFQDKHGRDGKGDPHATPPKLPYVFGLFVNKHNRLLNDDNKRARFLIDAGTNRWDNSLQTLQEAIRISLTSNPPKQVQIIPQLVDPAAPKATARVFALMPQLPQPRIEVELASDGAMQMKGSAIGALDLTLVRSFDIELTCPPTDEDPSYIP